MRYKGLPGISAITTEKFLTARGQPLLMWRPQEGQLAKAVS